MLDILKQNIYSVLSIDWPTPRTVFGGPATFQVTLEYSVFSVGRTCPDYGSELSMAQFFSDTPIHCDRVAKIYFTVVVTFFTNAISAYIAR